MRRPVMARPCAWLFTAIAFNAFSDTAGIKVHSSAPRSGIGKPPKVQKLRGLTKLRALRPLRPQAKHDTPFDKSALVFVHGTGGYGAFRIPALLRVPPSTVLAFSEARVSPHDSGRTDLVMRRSTDDGRTWGPLQLVAGDKRGGTVGNPAPVYDNKTRTVFLMWCLNNTQVHVQRSKDGGQNWTEATDITSQVKRPGIGWIATGPNHGTQLRSGRLIIPFNSLLESSHVKITTTTTGCKYIEQCSRYKNQDKVSGLTEVEITNPLDPAMPPLRMLSKPPWELSRYLFSANRAGVLFSDDHGITWQLGGMVDSFIGSGECAAAETPQGLLLSFRAQTDTQNHERYKRPSFIHPHTQSDNGHCRKMALSKDGGRTFQPYFQPKSCIPDPVCQGSLLALEDGRVVTSGPGDRSKRVNLQLFISKHNVNGTLVKHSEQHNGTSGNHSEHPAFRPLAQVAVGFSSYSDVAELGPSAPGGPPVLGVLYEGLHGLSWATVMVPNEHDLIA